jgi:putative tryptophan/tyrosine transport system ATP-binding protein
MLTLKGLSKSFPFSFEPALKNIHLEVQPQDFCIVIGSNGSGKSTLLKAVTGEYKLDQGHIFFQHQNITPLSLHKRSQFISCVTQDVSKGTIEEMTLLENMALCLMRNRKASFSFYKNQEEDMKRSVAELGLGLEAQLDKPMSTLSGGQRQTLATVMALMSSPSLLLLDEHTSALDPSSQKKLMDYTSRKIKEKEMTTLMITHDLEDALLYGNRLIMLHKGQIVVDMNAEEKQKLNPTTILELFHHFEDQSLLHKAGGQ